MEREQILREFTDAEAILKGHFVLSSGLHSDTYLQCARVLMDARRADRLCKVLADKVRTRVEKVDLIVAPAMGGVIVGYEMGRQLGVESIFCERQDGRFTLRRGFAIPKGSKVLVVEDVVTQTMRNNNIQNNIGKSLEADFKRVCLNQKRSVKH